MKINGKHMVVVGLLAIVALSYFWWHPLGWGASAPAIAGDNSEVLEAIGGINDNISKVDQKASAALNTANAALNTSKLANATASGKLITPVASATGAVVAVASATNTMDDKALTDAKTLLAKANRIASDAERFKREARDLDSDEEDDASELEEDIDNSKDDRDEVKADIEDLQDTIYQDWANTERNETAKDLAGQTLTKGLDALGSAKDDYKDAMSDIDDILEPENEGDGKVVYVQAPVSGGQQTTPQGVAGYQSQTEGL